MKHDKSKVDEAVRRARVKHELGRQSLIDNLEAMGLPGEIAADLVWETFERDFRKEFEGQTLQ